MAVPITSYTVTPYVGAWSRPRTSFSSSATSHVVVGLTNGTAYTFTVAATNAVGHELPRRPSHRGDAVAPTLSIVNGGAKAGRAQVGDQIIVTFSPAPSPSSFCAAWSATSYPDLVDPNVVVTGTQSSSGDDTVTVTDAADCNGGFHFGTIDLGQGGYFTRHHDFRRQRAGVQSGGKTIGMFDDPLGRANTLTITLGKATRRQRIRTAPVSPSTLPIPPLASRG